MEKLIVKIKIVSKDSDLNIPKYATKGSAGMDIYCCMKDERKIMPGEIAMIPSGIAIQILDKSVGGFVFPRSGLSSKYGISLINCVGVIDSDYTGEIICPVINHGKEAYTIKNGDRIAQIVFMPIIQPDLLIVDELLNTDRGDSGFGSTGK